MGHVVHTKSYYLGPWRETVEPAYIFRCIWTTRIKYDVIAAGEQYIIDDASRSEHTIGRTCIFF